MKLKGKGTLSGELRAIGHEVICLRLGQAHLERKEVLYLSTGGGFSLSLILLFGFFSLSNIRGDVHHLSDSLRLFPWRPIFSVCFSAGLERASDAAGPLGTVVTVVM